LGEQEEEEELLLLEGEVKEEEVADNNVAGCIHSDMRLTTAAMSKTAQGWPTVDKTTKLLDRRRDSGRVNRRRRSCYSLRRTWRNQS
jgi:hypothetical protein